MSQDSRNQILKKLRAVQQPFTDVAPITTPRHVSLLEDSTPAGLQARFTQEVQALFGKVYAPATPQDAVSIVLQILGEDTQALMWDAAHIPLPELQPALVSKGVQPAALRDSAVRVGITGADAALAATGSLVVVSGAGKPRQASLLPLVHVAIVKQSRILPDLEAFIAERRAQGTDEFRTHSNYVIISGPSRSADIAMEMILGMHGPAELHIIIVP